MQNSQKLQMNPELTLENAKKKIRQEGAVQEQNQELNSTGIAGESRNNPIEIGHVARKHLGTGRQQLG